MNVVIWEEHYQQWNEYLLSLNQIYAALISFFVLQVCIAKCNSTSSLDVVLSQDLTVVEGPAVEVGDSLEVAYTGWLFQNHVLGQVRECTCKLFCNLSSMRADHKEDMVTMNWYWKMKIFQEFCLTSWC